MSLQNIFFLLFLSLLCSSCRKQVIQPPNSDLGYAYQPLTKGHYVIYDVDSVLYNDFTESIDTVSWQVKDEIGDSFVDDEGRTSNYVQRSQRKSSSDPWQIDHVFYITKDNFKLEWKENNLRFIKMVFPVKINKKWQGNTYIPTRTNPELTWLDSWDYRYSDVVTSFNTGKKTYRKTHIVDQEDFLVGDLEPTTVFSARIYSREVWAENVGMVYREITNWEFQPSTSNFRKGFTVYFRARSNN